MIGRFNGVILPLAKAPAPWNMVHSFRVQPQSAQTRPLQSPGCPPPPALSDWGQCPLSSAQTLGQFCPRLDFQCVRVQASASR